jgi:hypothetical protein
MNILVACEYSGRARDAFILRGHSAVSCDLLSASGPHIKGDVLEHLDGWDMMVAFPPCTHLAVSGATSFAAKRADGRQQGAIDFFMALASAPIPRIAIENPIGIMSTVWRKPDQIVQPYWFGDAYKKSTCLWLKNLPPLHPVKAVAPEFTLYKSLKTKSGFSRYSKLGRMGKGHGHERSLTPQGMADAMAEQWGCPEETRAGRLRRISEERYTRNSRRMF